MSPRYQLAFTRRAAGVALVSALAALLGILSPSPDDLHPPPTHASLFPAEFLERSPLHDRVFEAENDANGELLGAPRYAFGRWRTPATNVTFHSDGQGLSSWKTDVFQTKRWHYSSFNARDYFIGMAVVKLGYANDAFLYVVDKTAPGGDKFEYAVRLLGSIGLSFAASSIDAVGCSASQKPFSSEWISFCYEQATGEWKISARTTTISATTGEARLFSAELFMVREEALALLFPLGNDSMRPAYVHKAAGSPVRGTFSFGNVSVELRAPHDNHQIPEALGAIDWTRSRALRCTRWNWASTSFRGPIRRAVSQHVSGESEPGVVTGLASIGINLSKDVYDIDGESQENAIWVNGKVFPLRGVHFTVPDDPVRGEWQIRSAAGVNGELVDLTFRPQGSREDHTKLLIMESDFVQPYGTFNGYVRFTDDHGSETRVEVEEAFGVVEKHFAVW